MAGRSRGAGCRRGAGLQAPLAVLSTGVLARRLRRRHAGSRWLRGARRRPPCAAPPPPPAPALVHPCHRCLCTTQTCATSASPPTWRWCTRASPQTPSPRGTARSPCACWATTVRKGGAGGRGWGRGGRRSRAGMVAVCPRSTCPPSPPCLCLPPPPRRRDQHPARQRQLDAVAAGHHEVPEPGPVPGAHAAEGEGCAVAGGGQACRRCRLPRHLLPPPALTLPRPRPSCRHSCCRLCRPTSRTAGRLTACWSCWCAQGATLRRR